MTAGALELADILRDYGPAFRDAYGDTVSPEQHRVLRDLVRCRTAALGGHVEECDRCGHRQVAYNSCRNRHCPKCQATAAADWVAQNWRSCHEPPSGNFPENGARGRRAATVKLSVSRGKTPGTLPKMTGYCWRIRLESLKPRIRLPRATQIAQVPTKRPSAGIRQQYQCWVYLMLGR